MAQSDIICYDNTLAELEKQTVAKKRDANTERIKSWNCKVAPEAPVTSATRSKIRTDARKFLAGEVKAVRHAIVQREVAICNKRKAEIEVTSEARSSPAHFTSQLAFWFGRIRFQSFHCSSQRD